MKKIFLLLLIILPIYLIASFYFLDKEAFICPIVYNGDYLIRSDGRGNGYFASDRSGNRMHEGVDFLADIGTQVLAVRSGFVAAARRTRGMGNFIVLKHPGRIVTIYGHLSRIFVIDGQFVRQGQVIGLVGKTGNANYRNILAHLHFELRKDGIPQDPLAYLE